MILLYSGKRRNQKPPRTWTAGDKSLLSGYSQTLDCPPDFLFLCFSQIHFTDSGNCGLFVAAKLAQNRLCQSVKMLADSLNVTVFLNIQI
jgi:hypothetical protein